MHSKTNDSTSKNPSKPDRIPGQHPDLGNMLIVAQISHNITRDTAEEFKRLHRWQWIEDLLIFGAAATILVSLRYMEPLPLYSLCIFVSLAFAGFLLFGYNRWNVFRVRRAYREATMRYKALGGYVRREAQRVGSGDGREAKRVNTIFEQRIEDIEELIRRAVCPPRLSALFSKRAAKETAA